MACDQRFDAAGPRRGFAPHSRDILPAEIARPPVIGELPGQAAMRGIGLGRDHQPARVLIQPSVDSQRDAANAGQAFPAMCYERVHERSSLIPSAG